MVTLWKLIRKNALPHIHCNAAVIGSDKLMTTPGCVESIHVAFNEHGNKKFPHYYATIGSFTEPEKRRHTIKSPYISTRYLKDEQACGIIDVSQPLEINKIGRSTKKTRSYIYTNSG